MIVTESSWVPPLSYQSEGPFLVAAYESLTGIDGYYWFTTAEEGWREPGSANGFMPSEGKWVCATPMLMGQWPAAALMYRLHYIEQAKPVVYEERSLDDLWQRRMPIVAEDPGYDPNRDKAKPGASSNIITGVDPLAYLVGPVVVKYAGDPAKNQIANLGQYIHKDRQFVESVTGQLQWDFGQGICTLNSPKAQGVAGFLKQHGDFELADTEIQCSNDYATVLIVAMDDKPLRDSDKILVQVGTKERPAGWKTKPAQVGGQSGEEVVSFGHAPWMIERAEISITVKNPKISQAYILDPNGMSVKEIQLRDSGGGKSFAFPPNALYVVLQSKSP
jgi:hypothetical protein